VLLEPLDHPFGVGQNLFCRILIEFPGQSPKVFRVPGDDTDIIDSLKKILQIFRKRYLGSLRQIDQVMDLGRRIFRISLRQDCLQHFLNRQMTHEYDVKITASLIHGIRRPEIVIRSRCPVSDDAIHVPSLNIRDGFPA
jgi:hypothetical protein